MTIKIRSSSSRRNVPIMRSQIAFARGAWGGLVSVRMSCAAKTASNALLNRESRSRRTNLRVLGAVGKVHQQVAGSLGCPCSGRVRADPEQMCSAGIMLDPDQDVDPPKQNGVSVQVHSEDGLSLCGEELAPGWT